MAWLKLVQLTACKKKSCVRSSQCIKCLRFLSFLRTLPTMVTNTKERWTRTRSWMQQPKRCRASLTLSLKATGSRLLNATELPSTKFSCLLRRRRLQLCTRPFQRNTCSALTWEKLKTQRKHSSRSLGLRSTRQSLRWLTLRMTDLKSMKGKWTLISSLSSWEPTLTQRQRRLNLQNLSS